MPVVLVAVGILVLAGMWLRPWSHQAAARYLVAVAAVEGDGLTLDRYGASLGADFAIVNGRVVSDKAPFQPWLAAIPYRAFRAGGGEPFPEGLLYAGVGTQADVGLWMVTFGTSVVPLVVLFLLIRRSLADVGGRCALCVATVIVTGTLLLPFGSMLFGHGLAALVGFAAWRLVCRIDASNIRLLLGGGLLGCGPGVEFPQVAVAAVIGVICLVRHHWRAVWVAGGGVLGLLPLFLYNTWVFGGPFRTAYQGYLPNFSGAGAFGVFNLQFPQPEQLVLALVGDRGLLTLTPVLLVSVVSAVAMVRTRHHDRTEAILALVLLGLYLLISTGIHAYGGMSPGPRYLVPIIPFFARPLAYAWSKVPLLAAATGVWGSVWMVAAMAVDPLYADEFQPAMLSWGRDLMAGNFQRSILTPSFGDAGTFALLALGVGLVCVGLLLDRRPLGALGSPDERWQDTAPSPGQMTDSGTIPSRRIGTV